MVEAKITTRHPRGKSGVRISKAKYDLVRRAILESLDADPPITFARLIEEVAAKLAGAFEGSVSWYVTTVKLDMEARREIERVPASSPQRLRAVAEWTPAGGPMHMAHHTRTYGITTAPRAPVLDLSDAVRNVVCDAVRGIAPPREHQLRCGMDIREWGWYCMASVLSGPAGRVQDGPGGHGPRLTAVDRRSSE